MNNTKKALILSILSSFALISCSNNNEKVKENDEVYEIVSFESTSSNTSILELSNKIEEEPKEKIFVPYGYKDIDGEIIRDTSIFLSVGNFGYFKEFSYLYNNIGENAATTIDTYQKAFVIASNEIYYFIQTLDGNFYYTKASNIELLPELYVEVDLSDQKLYVFDNGEEIMNSDIITGKPSTPTDEGYTEILEKTYNRPLIGPTWNVDVNYFFPFNYSGEGFHDAYWQSNFGSNTYEYSGSHGCVNMKLEDVKKLDNYIEVGTKVLVHK